MVLEKEEPTMIQMNSSQANCGRSYFQLESHKQNCFSSIMIKIVSTGQLNLTDYSSLQSGNEMTVPKLTHK